jgi:uncharacterized protein (DUF697 family)
MEMTTRDCPGCGARLRLPAVAVASIFKCPKCGERERVEGGAGGTTDAPDRRASLREKADRIVQTHVVWAVGAGLVPVPLLDIAAVTGIQLDMLKQLCSLYQVRYTESQGKSWVASLSGSILARMGASVIKSVPVIGSILGGVSMSALSGAATYALGRVTAAEFEQGGDFETADLEKAREAYADELERGKEFASRMAKDKDGSHFAFEKLEKLAALREKGILSESEYEEQKKKILDQL